jgi:hypothetical protein
MDGNGDLAKLSAFVAGYEKYVETFTQYGFRIINFASESCRSGTVMLGLGILIPPAASGAGWPLPKLRNQASRNPISLQLTHVAVVGSAKYVYGELKGNKPDSPCQPHCDLLEGYQGTVMGGAHPDRLPEVQFPSFVDRRWVSGLDAEV